MPNGTLSNHPFRRHEDKRELEIRLETLDSVINCVKKEMEKIKNLLRLFGEINTGE